MVSHDTPKLYTLYIYANAGCNLACRHCWVTALRRTSAPEPEVSFAQYRDFIDAAIPLGLGYVKISGGEALLSRDLVLSLLEHAGAREIQTRLETNGTLLDEEVAEVLARNRAQVSISLDGSTPALHEYMRMVPGCFDAAIDGLDNTRKYGVPVEIVMSVYRRNADDVEAMVDLIRSLGLKRPRLKLNPVMASGRGRVMERRGERLSADELQQFIKQLETRYRESDIPVTVSAEPAFHSLDYITKGLVGGGSCGFRNLLGILADGSISFCGMGYEHSEYVFGRLGKCSLEEMWTGHPRLLKVRAQVPGQLEGVCGNCILRSACQGGCRSNAYDVFGSITAPSPGCQEFYDAGLFPISRLLDPAVDGSYDPPDADSLLTCQGDSFAGTVTSSEA
jgi:AdoMet-dependent heme synthase